VLPFAGCYPEQVEPILSWVFTSIGVSPFLPWAHQMCALLSRTSSARTPRWPSRLCRRVSMSRKIGLSLSRLPPLARFPSSSPPHRMGRSLLRQPWSQPSPRSKAPSSLRGSSIRPFSRDTVRHILVPEGIRTRLSWPRRPCVRSARSADVGGPSHRRELMVTACVVWNLSALFRRTRRPARGVASRPAETACRSTAPMPGEARDPACLPHVPTETNVVFLAEATTLLRRPESCSLHTPGHAVDAMPISSSGSSTLPEGPVYVPVDAEPASSDAWRPGPCQVHRSPSRR